MNSTKSVYGGSYRWWVLVMAAWANFVVIGASWMSVPVLFSEISQETGLHLQQLLFVWGMIPLASLIASIPAGILGDRFGVRWVCGVGLLMCALVGALRGLAFSFSTFMTAMFLFGASISFVGVNVPKMLGAWFPPQQLGLANGVVLSSNAIGAALALVLSATVLSPALGGWQHVLYLWSGVTVVLALLWLLTAKDAPEKAPVPIQIPQRKITDTLGMLLRRRQIMLLCLIYLLFMGAYIGFSGSTPFLLEHVGGWSAASAHSYVSIGLWSNIIGSFAIPMVSDRIGLRRPVLAVGFLLCGSAGFLSFLLAFLLSNNWMSWVLAAISGFFAGVVPLTFAIPVETPGIGPRVAGTAVGIIMASGNLGGYLFPTLTGWISGSSPGMGASIAIIALCFIGGYGGAGAIAWLLQETGPRVHRGPQTPSVLVSGGIPSH